ncbi:MarR family transcriptional regulator [Halosimplex halophilum]|uniref:MarR family transcriptional regulator n=1 Tax=Halosimplex halophilum TaxID=2559572 RepID=UPI00107F300D|nr:helix-turn-helix domain-containing protein [Halosimplex halophilum]
MSIDRETFREATEEELESLSVPQRVLGFLVAHDDRAFEASEIADRSGIDENAVRTALTRLKQRGLVEHKATYWAVTESEERLATASGYERATALFNERLGEEDREGWRERAPDEQHPSLTDEQ